MKRIVITGVGACSAVGSTADMCFSSFLAGQKGNASLKELETDKYNKKNAYERDEDGLDGRKKRSSQFLKNALQEAIASSGLSQDTVMPVYIGTGLRELRTAELAALAGEKIQESDLDFKSVVNQVLPQAGDVFTLSNACAASNFALALAVDKIQTGDTDIAIAGGCDTLTSSMFGLLDRVNPLSPDVVKVFDQDRQGVLMGDGGVALIVETLESAVSSNRMPLAEIKGVGLGCDAFHETSPDTDGIESAINDAYSRAGIAPKDVDLIYVHGTGTELNDAAESKVLNRVFADVKKKPSLSGIKSMTGHTSGASGGIGVVAAIKSIQQQVVPPTPGTTKPVAEIVDFPIYQEAQSTSVQTAQINAFGFGGVNAVVIIEAFNQGAA